MNAKEKQIEFIKTYLKPALKNFGYKTNRQTWWKDKGDFFILLNLQNFSWNTADSINFCFNIGVVLKTEMKDNSKNPQIYDLTVSLRENFYLPDNRKEYLFRNKMGFILHDQTDLIAFTKEVKSDFENYILPKLDRLNSLQDCIDNFGNIPFFGDRLKNTINKYQQSKKIKLSLPIK